MDRVRFRFEIIIIIIVIISRRAALKALYHHGRLVELDDSKYGDAAQPGEGPSDIGSILPACEAEQNNEIKYKTLQPQY